MLFKAFATSAVVSLVPWTGCPVDTFISAHFSDHPDLKSWNDMKLLILLGNHTRAGRTALSDTVWVHSSSLQIFLLSLPFPFFPTHLFTCFPVFPAFLFPLFPFYKAIFIKPRTVLLSQHGSFHYMLTKSVRH